MATTGVRNLMPGEWELQQQQIDRKRKLAEALQQQSMEAPQGQMVSGHYVQANPLQYMAKMLQGYNAKKEMEGYDQQQRDIVNGEREKQTAAAKALAQALSPQQVQQPISYEDAGGMPGAEQTVTQQPTQDQVFGALGNYYSQVDPSQLGSIALEKLKYGQADQAREDQQQFNRENLNLQLTTSAQARQDAREQRAQELQLRLQDAQASRQEQALARKELAQMQIDARTDLARMQAGNQMAIAQLTKAASNQAKVSPGYRELPDGSWEAIKGGPADQKALQQGAGRETVDSVVAGLRTAYDSLDAGGGITSTKQSGPANIGRWASQSAIGQAIGGAVGSENQKQRDSIAQARPLLLQAIMKATGMSAKQMDSNAELKLYLATATDPTKSLEANREALDRIEQLYGSGAGNQSITGKQQIIPQGAEMPKKKTVKFGDLK
jgi:hypothetical protein